MLLKAYRLIQSNAYSGKYFKHYWLFIKMAWDSHNEKFGEKRSFISYFTIEQHHTALPKKQQQNYLWVELRGKIPAFTENESKFLEDAKQKDFEEKKKMKTYHDKCFNTKESSINVGDYVLLWQKPKNKLSNKFNYKVISKKGVICLIEKDGITKMRNSSFYIIHEI